LKNESATGVRVLDAVNVALPIGEHRGWFLSTRSSRPVIESAFPLFEGFNMPRDFGFALSEIVS
jgi:hypothetical protein